MDSLELVLKRKWFSSRETIGELSAEELLLCYTLEDVVRPAGEKVYGSTAIPFGRYRVEVTYSARFKRKLPILLAVPNFEGIRMHGGNTYRDTEGCILVGASREANAIRGSAKPLEMLTTMIATANCPVWITITAEKEDAAL